MRNHHRLPSVQSALAASLGLLLWSHPAQQTLAATNATNSTASETTVAARRVQVPKSVFAIPSEASEGRDPFFPLSRRWVVNSAPKNTDNVKVAPVSLALKGISGTELKRYALINDKTFEAGEEREINRVRVRCIQIREDSVTVEVNGARQELRLRPGL